MLLPGADWCCGIAQAAQKLEQDTFVPEVEIDEEVMSCPIFSHDSKSKC